MCKGVKDDGTAHSYADCDKFGATAANLLTSFPTTPEDNKRLKEMLRAEKNSGDPTKAQYDLGMAKRCLTQLWYTPEQGKARLELCAPPKKSSKKKSASVPPRNNATRSKISVVTVPKSNAKRSVKATSIEPAKPFF